MREAVVAACTKRIKEVLAELSALVDAEIEVLEGRRVPFSSNTPMTRRCWSSGCMTFRVTGV
jgi:hypothetical protein